MVAIETQDITPGQAAPPRGRNVTQPSRYVAAALLLLAVGIWLTALPLLRQETAGQYGLLATRGGVVLLLSAAVGIVAFVWAIATNNTRCAVLAIVTVTVIERMTATLITEVPIYVWTYKHIGIVEYMIDRHSSPHVQVYGDWPSFFSTMAWFSTISGLDPVDAAHGFAFFATALTSLMVGALAMSAGFSMRAGLIAAMLAVLINWTGQDYYSPQATGLILALAILTLLLHSKKTPLAGYLSVPLFAVFVATHQLTPFWICLVTIGAAVLNRIRPRWLGLLYPVILVTYVLPRLSRAGRFDLFSGFDPVKNGTVVAESRGSDGREFTILIERGLAVSIWLLAAVCFIIVWRRHGAPWALGVAAFSSMVILGGQNYGGEAIIRVYLYSIAGCSLLLAIVIAPIFDLRKPLLKLLGCVLITLFFLGVGLAGMQGYYGGWSYVTVTRAQLEQSRQLLATSGGQMVVANIAQNVGWPEGSTAEHVHLKLLDPAYDAVLDNVRPSLLHKEDASFRDVQSIERALPKRNGPPLTLYVVFTRQLSAYGEYLGWFPTTFVPSLIERLSKREGWTKVIDDENTVVFAYVKKKR
jgi:hypothetical protein